MCYYIREFVYINENESCDQHNQTNIYNYFSLSTHFPRCHSISLTTF